ncbi:hypothetical protein QYF61_023462 [Mycteria americana]|uniref:Uncharacterized protein n=1 Tax=Mycteria americana TaxID=33587 RepID=A0AAN7PB73_MYCAM|nr:hypothetical protein QYF61_023462 [Mycteria americana]
MFLFLYLLNVCQVLLRVKQLFKNTASTPNPVTGTVATPTTTTGTVTTQTLATGTAAESENQPVPASVVPIHKKKSWKRKSARLVKDEEASPKREQEEEASCPASEEADYPKTGPSQEQEEEEEEFPASPRGRTRQKGSFFSSEGEKELINKMHIVTWLLQCWDNGASSLELEGKEAKQLGSLSREAGIDKEIGKRAQDLSL